MQNLLTKKQWTFTFVSLFFLIYVSVLSSAYAAESQEAPAVEDTLFDDEYMLPEDETPGVADPLEPINRVFFQFNDKLYFWVLKPVATGYKKVIHEEIRVSIRDFFHNLLAPIRVVNNLLQGKVKQSGVELGRFVVNSTIGVVGLADVAKQEFGLVSRDEDLGQTLGVYGLGGGIYICWPVLGPSNIRDTVGMVGDAFLDPITYLAASDAAAGIAVRSEEAINHTSLTLGDYEHFKESAFDPYLALRDAYFQYRRSKIRDEMSKNDSIF